MIWQPSNGTNDCLPASVGMLLGIPKNQIVSKIFRELKIPSFYSWSRARKEFLIDESLYKIFFSDKLLWYKGDPIHQEVPIKWHNFRQSILNDCSGLITVELCRPSPNKYRSTAHMVAFQKGKIFDTHFRGPVYFDRWKSYWGSYRGIGAKCAFVEALF